MELIELIKDKYRIISVVGMEKNVGKTVVLNELLEQIEYENMVVAITSIGRDGESKDIIFSTEKPLIYITTGTIFATLEIYIEQAEIEIEILEITDAITSMGRVIIGRAKQDGYIQIAGPSSNKGIKDVSNKMLNYGAELVIVDGALNRVSSASPAITEATILSTGAILDRDLKKVVSKTYHQVHLFSIKSVKDIEVNELIKEAINNSGVTLIDKNLRTKRLNIKTVLNSSKTINKEIDRDTRYIVFTGSLTTKVVKEIYEANGGNNVIFVVRDATKLFVTERELNLFIKLGIRFNVLNEINLLAITINPYSPMGYSFNAKVFKKEMEKYFKNIMIYNVLESGEK
ncbi:MAG: hypothetical protein U9N10_05835 [Bacillota bacterium]|nr:hypothetical protein [Bacillota bacterium]